MNLPVISNTRMKAARGCLRFDKIRYRLGYRAVRESKATRFGSLVHRGLEAWFNAWKLPDDERLAVMLAALSTPEEGKAAPDPFDLVAAEELLAAYHYRWLDERYEVIGVEVEFEGPLVDPDTGFESHTYGRGGKIDALVRDGFGRKLLVEHKTSGEDIRSGSPYWVRLRMDSQVSTYYEGARILGHEIEACIYDVIGKPSIKPHKATPPEKRKYTKATKSKPSRPYANQRERDETPDEFRLRLAQDIAENVGDYFRREEVVRLETEIHAAMRDDWEFALILAQSEAQDRAPRNPDACFKYGQLCEYHGVCTGADSLDDQTRFVRSDRVNPELREPTAPAVIVAGVGDGIGTTWEMFGTFEDQIERARKQMENT